MIVDSDGHRDDSFSILNILVRKPTRRRDESENKINGPNADDKVSN